MPDSNITCAGLTLTPGIGHNLANWTFTDPNANGLNSLSLGTVELHAATANDRSLATKVAEGRDSAPHMSLIEGATYYYWVRARNKAGFYGDWHPSGETSGVVGTAGFSIAGGHGLINGKLVVAVEFNQVTINIYTLEGEEPSVIKSNPVFMGFRDADGTYVVRSIETATRLLITSGSTLGATNGSPLRAWVVGFDDAGVVRLAVINCCDGVNVAPLSEVGDANAVSEGGVGGADSYGVFYSSQIISNKRYRVLGFLEWGAITTAGQYAVYPDVVHLVGAVTQLPGAVVQRRISRSATNASGVADIPVDNTAPQVSEGLQVTSYSGFIPTASANLIKTRFRVHAARSSAGELIAAAFNDGSSNALHVSTQDAAANIVATIDGENAIFAGGTASRGYEVRVGASGGATVYVNGNSGGALYGGAMRSELEIIEIVG